MLEVLRRRELTDLVAVVTRYFGGVKLGAGGLVRAYTDSVAQALQQARKLPLVRHTTLRCVLPYALEGWLRRELPQHDATLLAATHGEGVTVALQLPQTRAKDLVARLNEAGQGQVVWLPDTDAATGP